MKKTISLMDVQKLHQEGRLNEAKQGYLEILEDNPKEIAALHALALLYAEEGELDLAQKNLELAIHWDPHGLIHYLHLANILKAKANYTDAIKLLQGVVEKNPKFAAAHNNLGTLFYAEGKWLDAVRAYQLAIEQQPNYIDAYYNLGLALGKLNRNEEARQAFQAVVELAPQHTGAQFHLGSLLMKQYKFKEAAEIFTAIIEVYPHHFESLTNLATSYLRLGRIDLAKQYYLKALELTPTDLQVLFNLGVLNLQQGLLEEAIEYYSRAVALDANLYDAQNNLAFTYLAMRRNDKALEHFKEAARIQPQNEAIRHTIDILTQNKNVTTSPPEYVRSLFDSYADHFDAHLTNVLHYQVPQKLYHALSAAVDIAKVKWNVLDLGCGTGLCGVVFKPLAQTLSGVDLSGKMLNIAAERKIYDFLFQADIVPFLKDKVEEYHLIIAGDVLVYSGDLNPIIANVAKALQPQGYFVFNTEILDQGNFQITQGGRFAHQKEYIDKLAFENQLSILEYEVLPLRTQDEKVVYGHVYVLQKLAA